MSYAAGIVVQALLSVQPVTAIVRQKIQLDEIGGKQPPAVYVFAKSENEPYLLENASGHVRSTIAVACLATTGHGVHTLAEAVIAGLKNFSGTAAGVHATIMKEGTDVTDHNHESGLHRRVVDFTVIWRR